MIWMVEHEIIYFSFGYVIIFGHLETRVSVLLMKSHKVRKKHGQKGTA